MTGHTQTQTPHTGDKPRVFSICVALDSGWNWCYKAKDLRKTLRKLLDNHRDELIGVWIQGDASWIGIAPHNLEKFINGEEIPVIYHVEHPFFEGLKAFGYAHITINDI